MTQCVDCSLSVLWSLSECSEWSLIPRERGRLTALDKLAPDGRTDRHCDTLSSCRSQKWTAIYSYFWVVVVVHKVLFSASVPKGLLGLHLIGFGTGIGTRLDNYFPSNILNLIHRAESWTGKFEMECCGKHLSFILTNKLHHMTVVTW